MIEGVLKLQACFLTKHLHQKVFIIYDSVALYIVYAGMFVESLFGHGFFWYAIRKAMVYLDCREIEKGPFFC